MTNTLHQIINFGFRELNAKVIEASYAKWNKGSEKVLSNNGMKFIKQIEKGYRKHGNWMEENMVAIEINEWTGGGIIGLKEENKN